MFIGRESRSYLRSLSRACYKEKLSQLPEDLQKYHKNRKEAFGAQNNDQRLQFSSMGSSVDIGSTSEQQPLQQQQMIQQLAP